MACLSTYLSTLNQVLWHKNIVFYISILNLHTYLASAIAWGPLEDNLSYIVREGIPWRLLLSSTFSHKSVAHSHVVLKIYMHNSTCRALSTWQHYNTHTHTHKVQLVQSAVATEEPPPKREVWQSDPQGIAIIFFSLCLRDFGLAGCWNEINCCHISSSNNVVIRRKAVAAAALGAPRRQSPRWLFVFPTTDDVRRWVPGPGKWDAHSAEWKEKKKLLHRHSYTFLCMRRPLFSCMWANERAEIIVQLEKIWPSHIKPRRADGAGGISTTSNECVIPVCIMLIVTMKCHTNGNRDVRPWWRWWWWKVQTEPIWMSNEMRVELVITLTLKGLLNFYFNLE